MEPHTALAGITLVEANDTATTHRANLRPLSRVRRRKPSCRFRRQTFSYRRSCCQKLSYAGVVFGLPGWRWEGDDKCKRLKPVIITGCGAIRPAAFQETIRKRRLRCEFCGPTFVGMVHWSMGQSRVERTEVKFREIRQRVLPDIAAILQRPRTMS